MGAPASVVAKCNRKMLNPTSFTNPLSITPASIFPNHSDLVWTFKGNGTEDDITVIITDKIVVESMDMGQCTFPEMLPAQTQWHIRKQQADKFCTCGEGKDGKEGGSGTNVSLITGIVAILWIVVLFVGGKMVARKRAVAAVAQANALSISADAGSGGSGGSDDDGEGTSSDAAQLLSNPNSSTTANAAFDPSGHTSQGADVSSA